MLSLLLLAQTVDHRVAVLESGRRVEIEAPVEVGDRRVLTPFGRYDASLDPVAEIVDGGAEQQLLAPLADLDTEQWLRRIAERGLLSPLAAFRPTEATTRQTWLEALTDWGRRLDPLPSDTPREARVERLWQRLLEADDATQALLTGALLREIPDSRQSRRRLGLVELRRALESKDAEVRRAAALIGGYQGERSLDRRLLESSVSDADLATRHASASALDSLDESRALGLWAVELWHGATEAERIAAAEHLGSYGAKEPAVAKVLIHTLAAAEGGGAPRSYVFFGRQVSYISDYDVEVALGAMIADPKISVLAEGVTLQIRVISTGLAGQVVNSLKRLTGQDFGRDREAWMRWYEKTHPEG